MIAVALSGGVDSSVAGLKAKDKWGSGDDLVGVHLHLWENQGDEASTSCCTPQSTRIARQTAEILGIPFYTFSMTELFRKKVVDPFIRAYQQGETPNPCVACNRSVKFGALMAAASRLGATELVTGHYARISGNSLLRACDRSKDQSYFLYGIPLAMRGRISFPTGGLQKEEVREMARKGGLPTASRPESQEICFVPAKGYREFLFREKVQSKRGIVRTLDGDALGSHEGVHRFTKGQRKQIPPSGGKRNYVLDMDSVSGTVTVGPDSKLWDLTFGVEKLRGWNLAALDSDQDSKTDKEENLRVRVRAQGEEVKCRVERLGRRSLRVELQKPLRAVTKGQSAVFYRGEELLGGGLIKD